MNKIKDAVSDINNISNDEYTQAYEICQRFQYQQDNTIQVSVRYDASILVTIRVPDDLTIDDIKENLKDGYYQFDKVDKDYTILGKITELIVNGDEIKL